MCVCVCALNCLNTIPIEMTNTDLVKRSYRDGKKIRLNLKIIILQRHVKTSVWDLKMCFYDTKPF